jgi:hypothetical protein
LALLYKEDKINSKTNGAERNRLGEPRCSAAHTPYLPLKDCELIMTEHTRLVVELEFVQCLANPRYLNCEFISALSAHDLS